MGLFVTTRDEIFKRLCLDTAKMRISFVLDLQEALAHSAVNVIGALVHTFACQS